MSHNEDYTPGTNPAFTAASSQHLNPKISGGKKLLIWVSTILLFVLAFLGWMSLVGIAYLWLSETFGNTGSDWDWMDITQLVLTILGVVGAAIGTIMVGRAWQKALKYRVLHSLS